MVLLQGPVVFLMGPTASGKSGMGLELARKFSMEIINADSVQLYRGFNIGAAKPNLDARGGIPHHLLDLVDPNQRFSADRYRQAAWNTIQECHHRGVVPLFVGGSNLYFRAVELGLVNTPAVEKALRDRLCAEESQQGLKVLHDRLKHCDPELAARISERDGQRIRQGLAVFEATGQPLSLWQKLQPPPPKLTILKLALEWPREMLYQRINDRFETMIASGLLDEARDILAQKHDPNHPAMKAVGYRQMFAFLQGQIPLDEAVEWAKRETRRYAKRQITWLKQEPGLIWVAWNNSHQVCEIVEKFIRNHPVLSGFPLDI